MTFCLVTFHFGFYLMIITFSQDLNFWCHYIASHNQGYIFIIVFLFFNWQKWAFEEMFYGEMHTNIFWT